MLPLEEHSLEPAQPRGHGQNYSFLAPVGRGRLRELSDNSPAVVGEQLPAASWQPTPQALYPFHWCRAIDKFPVPVSLYCRYATRALSIITTFARCSARSGLVGSAIWRPPRAVCEAGPPQYHPGCRPDSCTGRPTKI